MQFMTGGLSTTPFIFPIASAQVYSSSSPTGVLRMWLISHVKATHHNGFSLADWLRSLCLSGSSHPASLHWVIFCLISLLPGESLQPECLDSPSHFGEYETFKSRSTGNYMHSVQLLDAHLTKRNSRGVWGLTLVRSELTIKPHYHCLSQLDGGEKM